jgi:tetratricopeptide (TPR) repeat protein
MDGDDLTRAAFREGDGNQSIGPYRLLQRIGAGGMGEVWLAEQTRPISRHVAIKIIKPGMDSEQVVKRFQAERQALALMSHPCIAHVYEAGTTPQGRPFFAMEYIRGESITDYGTRHRLPIRERIELFLHVCDAVQHAHQKGIIHRDLKPSNILVTVRDDRPVPKIIDFGVAKATTQALGDGAFFTEIGALVGTPEYMSPEQVDTGALDVDTRSDVYALGVVLYELLTGTRPFDRLTLRDRSIEEVRRTIRESDPQRPSTRVAALPDPKAKFPDVAAPATSKELRGDLDWITMRALEKDRTRRYGSASDLAEDLRRHLDNQPVVAGPPGTAYRAAKFVRRHRAGVAAASLIALLLVVFSAAMALQAGRISRERDRANRAAQSALATSNFLVGLFRQTDPSVTQGGGLTAREMLDRGLGKIEELRDEPVVQSRLQHTLGAVYTSLALYQSAAPLLESAHATQRRVLGPRDDETLATLFDLAELRYAEGHFKDAEALYREVDESRRAVRGPEARETLEAEMAVGSALMQQGRHTESERILSQALQTQERLLGAEDPLTVNTRNELAVCYYQQSRYAESLPLAEQTLRAVRKSMGDNAPRTLISLGNVGDTMSRLGRFQEAEAILLRAVEGQTRVLGKDHPVVTRTIRQLIHAYERWPRPAEAAKWRLQLSPDTRR